MGYLRLSLIIAVIYNHLAGKTLAGPIAVYGFFVLSGYVITLVAHEIYNDGWKSKLYFLANRAVRVWPTYLACLVLSLLAMWSVDFTTGLYQQEFRLPTTWQGWLVQFTIVGQSDFTGRTYPERILPPAWSLSTEVVYYFIIGLITGQSRRLTTAAFFLSGAITVHALYQDYTFKFFYLSIQGPALAFFTGGMFYHWRGCFAGMTIRKPWLLIILANLILYLPEELGMPRRYAPLLYVAGFYLGYIIMCLNVSAGKPTRAEQMAADITYPMFLLHWPIGALICYHWTGFYQRSPDVFYEALPLIVLISAAMVFAVEMPTKKIRRRLRERAKTSSSRPS